MRLYSGELPTEPGRGKGPLPEMPRIFSFTWLRAALYCAPVIFNPSLVGYYGVSTDAGGDPRNASPYIGKPRMSEYADPEEACSYHQRHRQRGAEQHDSKPSSPYCLGTVRSFCQTNNAMGVDCKIADNSDPLRGFSHPIPTLLTCCVSVLPLALLGLEGLWGMIGVEKIGEIRRAYFEQHRSIKEIVRTLSGIARDGARVSSARASGVS